MNLDEFLNLFEVGVPYIQDPVDDATVEGGPENMVPAAQALETPESLSPDTVISITTPEDMQALMRL